MNENINLNYLESLQGKAVKVFKGGPESRKGQLISVKSDYLVLSTNEEGVVIYQTSHIKSVIEDSTTSMNTSNNESVMTTMSMIEETNTFSDVLTAMKDQMVRIDRGGPEARNGRLLDVKGDYLVLYTEKDGVVYYQLEHVKSLSYAVSDNKNGSGNNNNQAQAQNGNTMSMVTFVKPEYVEADNFTELLKNMRYKWVTINRGGPESMQGVLADSSDGHLVLICEKEVCRIATFHIRNISYVLKQENNQNAENNQNQQESNENNQNQNQNENQNNDSNNQKNQNKNNSKKSFSIKMYSGSTKSRL